MLSLVLLGVEHFFPVGRVPARWSGEATTVVLAMLGLAAICLFSMASIEIHHRLYESFVWQDWTVRIPLVQTAMRGGVPPANPMFAVAGQAPKLHYYYYWFVLCARVAQFTHTDARAALAASCVWAGYSLVAILFLCMKYLPISTERLRRLCATSLLVGCVIGLDILPAVIGLFLPRTRLYPDIEFWHSDRSPSWLGAFLWAPHHVGGLVCCLVGLMALVAIRRESTTLQSVLHLLIAAIAFSAAVGTSTYICIFFALIGLLLLLERAWHREWKAVSALVLTGICCIAFCMPYLKELTTSSAAKGATARRNGFLELSLRSNAQAHGVLNYIQYVQRHLPTPAKASRVQLLLRVPVIAGYEVAEFGFFLFILVYRFRKDFLSSEPMNANARLWWIIFAGFALPGFFLTSAALQSNNDLGRHAGMCMRFVLLIWSTPVVAEYFSTRGQGHQVTWIRPIVRRLAISCFLLGLAGQIWQMVLLRTYLPLASSGRIAAYPVPLRLPHMSSRFYDIREAMAAVTAATSPTAIVQSNPAGRLQSLIAFYGSRQTAAADPGCNAPFGGDASLCPAESLIQVFGGPGTFKYHGFPEFAKVEPLDPARVTVDAFREACQDQAISAMIATYSDPAWRDKDSWVWQQTPIFANQTARVFLCPARGVVNAE